MYNVSYHIECIMYHITLNQLPLYHIALVFQHYMLSGYHITLKTTLFISMLSYNIKKSASYDTMVIDAIVM